MTESDIRRIEVALAEIKGEVKAIRAENSEGKEDHKDFELRLRALERVRWLVAGGCMLAGSGLGALFGRLIG